jgi:hypothetical protein
MLFDGRNLAQNGWFIWGENEVVIDICASYIFLSAAVNDLNQ